VAANVEGVADRDMGASLEADEATDRSGNDLDDSLTQLYSLDCNINHSQDKKKRKKRSQM